MVQRKSAQSLSVSDISPEDIRRIRELLGLSQAEAGELLGGGPRAFTKYENGAIKPAASVVNLLRVLEANPGALATLSGAKVKPIENEGLGLFQVSGKHVSALSDRKLVLLVRKLLNAEALSQDLGMDRIHVAAMITAPDGGEDARIEWNDGPERTRFLPGRLCQFQMKAMEISPAEAGADVIDSKGAVKAVVQAALSHGGTYIILCSKSYANKEIKRREAAVLARLRGAGLNVEESRVQLRDADQIAAWVNARPSVAVWLLEQTTPGLLGPFRDWTHWAGRHEYESSTWIPDARLEGFRDKLRRLVIPARGVARVVGLSGYGKSRLTLEALGPTEEETATNIRLCDLVIYAVEQEAGSETIKEIVQNLADSGLRAIVVVDRCPQQSHVDLTAMVKRSGSHLSLVTIDHEVPRGPNLPEDTLLVGEAPTDVIAGMLKVRAPEATEADRPRLVKLASGFPQLARLIGDAWFQDISVASAPDEVLYDRILIGRDKGDRARIESAAMLIGAFGLVGARGPIDSELSSIAEFGTGLRDDDLRSVIEDLVSRGVAQMRGRLVALQPRPIALHLADSQWRRWAAATWDVILFGELPERLRTQAASRLAMLNTRPISSEVVKHVCRPAGPIDSLEALSIAGNADVLSSLAEVDPEVVVTLLERLLGHSSFEMRKAIKGNARRGLVHTLEKISFVAGTFERGALLLFDLALSENESWKNNATGKFTALFPALLANTEAGPDDRLQLIDDLLRSDDRERVMLVVKGLLAGAKADTFSRTHGPEFHGSRPALKPWQPKLWGDAWSYVSSCADRLADLARREDDIGALTRDGLGWQFRTYVNAGLIDDLERWVNQVTPVHPYWPQALNSLGDVLRFDQTGLDAPVITRVEKLVSRLTPNDVTSRVRFIVTEMPWDYPFEEDLTFEERQKRQWGEVENLVMKLLVDESKLTPLFPELSRGDQRMTFQFGLALAKNSAEPLRLRAAVIESLLATPNDQRHFGLATGFFVGLAERDPIAFDNFKLEASQSADLAPAFAAVSLHAGIKPMDVKLMCDCVRAGLMSPFALRSWCSGGELAKQIPEVVAPLFDLLFESSARFYSVGLDLMGMFVFQKRDRLEVMRPQLRAAAANVGKAEKKHGNSRMDACHFREMMQWILSKGSADRDACAIAMTLAQQLVADPTGVGQDFIRPLLPDMLSKFSHIVWPIVGQAIVSDRLKGWELQLALGDCYAFDNFKRPTILHLPTDMLFAWCHAHPDVAPAFVAEVVNVLTHRDRNGEAPEIDPIARRLLDEFGDREDVLRALFSNMHSFGWSGPRTTYYALYEKPLASLAKHPIGAVRRWSKKVLASMQSEFNAAKDEDDEQKALWGE